MAWRLYLSDRPIRRLDILPDKPSLLAAWTLADRVTYLDLQTGALAGEATLSALDLTVRHGKAADEQRKQYTASNLMCLPQIKSAHGMLYNNRDGTVQLYIIGNRELILVEGDAETPLDLEKSARPLLVAMDPVQILVGVLTTAGKLILYDRAQRLGTFDTGLTFEVDNRPALILNAQANLILISNGQRAVVMDKTGKIQHTTETPFGVGAVASSPDGKYVIMSDLESNVLRVYSGKTLVPTHQRFAVDLIADSKRAQLMSGSFIPNAAIGPVGINAKGTVVFAMSGMICVTSIAKMKPLPLVKSHSKN